VRGGARSAYTTACHHVKTLATASSSRPNSKALAMREEIAHPHMTFHPCMFGLCGGAAAVAAAVIGYDNVEVAARMNMSKRRS
jgi:hypothetical protein